MSVKVGVRVRPFNQREIDLNSKLCVEMINPMTRLLDPKGGDQFKDFTFDYSFWSHDQFQPDQNGYFKPLTQKYSDQKFVYERVGAQILHNAWQGYHCCLFAYGQTGAGKSYSMIGYGANKGIVPITCEQIFKKIHANDNPDKEYQVQVSMLEIYNQKVQDLLVPIDKRLKEYQIRQHKTLGVYVDGLSKHYVDTYQSIQRYMDQGNRNRSIAATAMNASSSRAHTIISVQFKQLQATMGKKRQKISVINLVDLAGSQRVGKTQATGKRLQEGKSINTSLLVLGNVISALADKSMNPKLNIAIPYRQSSLTRILQNALGGNSKTLMICAISPAFDNYDETLSTLRYADKAKKIQNKAVINESQTDKLIRTLTTQRDQLMQRMQMMEQQLRMFKNMTPGSSQMMQKMEQMRQLQSDLKHQNQLVSDYELTTQQKQAKEKQFVQTKFDKSLPYISTILQDPLLNRKSNCHLKDGQTYIGRKNTNPPNDIQIGGIGIRQRHIKIIKQQENYFLVPIDPQLKTDCFINAQEVTQKTQLYNLDRLVICNRNFFLVMIPQTPPREPIEENTIDFEFIQQQIFNKKSKEEQEQRQKAQQQAQKIQKQKQQQLQQLKKKLKQSEQQRKVVEEEKQRQRMAAQQLNREKQAERLKLEIQQGQKRKRDIALQSTHTDRTKKNFYVQQKLMKSIPLCVELNFISKEFKRDINFSSQVQMQDEQDLSDQSKKDRTVMIKVTNRQKGYIYWWDFNTLNNRYDLIKEYTQQYFQTGVIPDLPDEKDPFWDPQQSYLLAKAYVKIKALAYLFDDEINLPVVNTDQDCGQITVKIFPTDQTGQKNLCDEIGSGDEMEPQQLIGKPFDFILEIQSAKLPEHFHNVYLTYDLKISQNKSQRFQTNILPKDTQIVGYRHHHTYKQLTESLLNYLMNEKIVFNVYGSQHITQKSQQKLSPTKSSQNSVPDSKSPPSSANSNSQNSTDNEKQYSKKTSKSDQKTSLKDNNPTTEQRHQNIKNGGTDKQTVVKSEMNSDNNNPSVGEIKNKKTSINVSPTQPKKVQKNGGVAPQKNIAVVPQKNGGIQPQKNGGIQTQKNGGTQNNKNSKDGKKEGDCVIF